MEFFSPNNFSKIKVHIPHIKIVQRVRRSVIPANDLIPILFAVSIFILLDSLDSKPSVIIIDEEYTGKEKLISDTLRKLSQKKSKKEPSTYLRFKKVGRSSPAHKLAWSVHRKKGKNMPNIKKLSENDFLKLLF